MGLLDANRLEDDSKIKKTEITFLKVWKITRDLLENSSRFGTTDGIFFLSFDHDVSIYPGQIIEELDLANGGNWIERPEKNTHYPEEIKFNAKIVLDSRMVDCGT